MRKQAVGRYQVKIRFNEFWQFHFVFSYSHPLRFQSKKPNKVTGILGPCLNIKRGRHMDGTMPRSHLFIESESFWMKFIIFQLNFGLTAWKHQHPKGESEEFPCEIRMTFTHESAI